MQRGAQIVQHGVQAGLALLALGQHPGGGLVDILVGPLHHLKNGNERGRNVQRLHGGVHFGGQAAHKAQQFFVQRIGGGGVGDGAAEIFLAHGHRAGQQVA